jgi:glutathionyl-hydroquinone reductase
MKRTAVAARLFIHTSYRRNIKPTGQFPRRDSQKTIKMTTNGAATNGHVTQDVAPKITLYTNHRCPYAHRAHIALEELNLPFKEVIIDLDTPRPQW